VELLFVILILRGVADQETVVRASIEDGLHLGGDIPFTIALAR
jgi:hypothetical protein